MPHIVICEQAPQLDRAIAAVEEPAYGAVVTFTGNVRAKSRGRDVLFLEYSAYTALAEKELERIAIEAERQWTVRCAVEHRIGRVAVGEASIVIAAASPHRNAAFEAARWMMDAIKETVPIWKKEHFDGGSHWVEGADIVAAV